MIFQQRSIYAWSSSVSISILDLTLVHGCNIGQMFHSAVNNIPPHRGAPTFFPPNTSSDTGHFELYLQRLERAFDSNTVD